MIARLNFIRLFILLTILSVVLSAQPRYEKTNSAPGEFARLGFGARGIAMGNAISAYKTNFPISFYNPALAGFQSGNLLNAGYTFLSLDRSVNYLSFGRKFEFYSAKDSALPGRKPRATAGFAFGIINSGVDEIDGRDNHGFKTKTLSTSENLLFISLSNRFSDRFAAGLNAKLYYYKLYEDVSATSLAFDVGILYNYSQNLSFSFTLSDLNAAYRWDTSPIYSQEGSITDEKFPTTKKLGIAFSMPELRLDIAGEFEWNNLERKLVRVGAEFKLYENLFILAGLDKIHFYNRDEMPVPSLGISYMHTINPVNVGFDYAFSYEQFSLTTRHLINLKILF
ncbi:MAG: hypothetical protein HUU54_09275 [Ignavibacteriaceae bacterium]|nr:hypothetical protein [Ignavibacteriaceae bacterium]